MEDPEEETLEGAADLGTMLREMSIDHITRTHPETEEQDELEEDDLEEDDLEEDDDLEEESDEAFQMENRTTCGRRSNPKTTSGSRLPAPALPGTRSSSKNNSASAPKRRAAKQGKGKPREPAPTARLRP